jgi:hypothetical protein
MSISILACMQKTNQIKRLDQIVVEGILVCMHPDARLPVTHAVMDFVLVGIRIPSV